MNKKQKQRLNETLDKALAPPRKHHLDSLLDEYDDRSSITPARGEPAPQIQPPGRTAVRSRRTSPSQQSVPSQKTAPYQGKRPYRPATVTLPATVPYYDTVSDNDTSPRVVRGHLQVPNYISDVIAPSLKPDQWAVYYQLYRLSHGWGTEECTIGNKRLQQRTNIKETWLRVTIGELRAIGLIEVIEVVNTAKIKGTRYRINTVLPGDTVPNNLAVTDSSTVLPPDAVTSGAPIKTVNKVNTGATTHTGVSRFDLEECRRYARGQKGIESPDALAMKLFQSGIADSLIEEWLDLQNEPQAAPVINISDCPDCEGVVWINGKRCEHPQLLANLAR